MNTQTKAVTVDVNVNKSSALRIAANLFEIHKRINRILITAPNYFVTVDYKGGRDKADIESGMAIVKVNKRGV